MYSAFKSMNVFNTSGKSQYTHEKDEDQVGNHRLWKHQRHLLPGPGTKLHDIEIAACADIDPARAKAKAEEYQIPKALVV